MWAPELPSLETFALDFDRKMQAVAVASLLCLLLLHQAHGEGDGGGSAGATSALLFELPAATDFYANEGNAYFDPYQILFSQTIKVTSSCKSTGRQNERQC